MGCSASARQEAVVPMERKPDTSTDYDTMQNGESGFTQTSTGDWREWMSFNTFMNETENPQIFEYKFERMIGRGSHGQVYMVNHVETNEKFAAKIYTKPFLYKNSIERERLWERIAREIEIMSRFKHRNIMKLTEVLDDEETNSIIFILPYASHGSLLPCNATSNPIPEERAKWIFAQLAVAVKELHDANVVHRDIKPENVMMCDNDLAMLADFSTSMEVPPGNDILEETDGTPVYYSPEECMGCPFRAKPADVWSLGVSLYVMVFGRLPFFTFDDTGYYLTQLVKVSRMIQNDPVEFPAEISISSELRDLLEKVMDKNPDDRLTIEQVLDHPWVKSAGYDPENVIVPSYL